jgi:histidyl-tRNA synthetase
MSAQLCAACREHLAEVEAGLRDLGLAYVLDHRLVRGLDYYTRTTFEVTARSADLGAQNTVAGGGRYDGLVQLLGGPELPAIGFAIGVERLTLLLGGRTKAARPRVFIAAVGAAAQAWALKTAEALRGQGVPADLDYGGKSLKAQLRRADRLGARLVLLAGDDELARQTAVLRDMTGGAQREVPLGEAAAQVVVALGALSPPVGPPANAGN